MEELKRIGDTLISLRGNRGREAVANDLGISLSALCAYEDGKGMPRDEIKFKISEYYQVSGKELFCRKISQNV